MVSLRRFKAFVAFVVFSLSPVWTGWAAPALAGGLGPWAETEYTAIRLIAAVDSVPTDAKDLVLGLEFRLEPGWHIYWRSPGDAGLPPVVDWSASDNLAQADIRWPRPERYELLGIQTLGYQDHVIFPVGVTLDRPGEALAVDATVNYLACAEICIPYDANLTLDLPAGSGAPGAAAHDLSRFGSKVPRDGSAFGFSVIDAEVQGAGDAAKVRIAVQSASEPFGAPDLIVEGPVEWTFDPATVRLEEAGRRAVFDLPLYGLDLLGRPAVGEALRLTLLDGPRAADLSAKLEASKSAADSAMAGVSFLSMLALALLGGLILNLMPCVLPVLSIKVLGILAHGGAKKKGPVRRAFLATAAGIVASFLVLAAALIAVKAAGGVVGWGIQFQQPWFLAALALMTGLFAFNLAGLFDVRLSSGLAEAGYRAGDAQGVTGAFLQGVFATLLATPCSAPFVGTALGFAFSRGAGDILAIFTALGLGLALPYLVIALWPRLATALPRPGPWMVWVKHFLALALAGTTLWLLSLLAGAQSTNTALLVAALLAVSGLLLAFGRRFGGRTVWAGVALMVGAALIVPGHVPADARDGDLFASKASSDFVWAPFDPDRIDDLVAAGKVVYVDVTADWCVTCIVNKKVILADEEARAALQAADVITMQADWTKPDADIAAYLASFGRYAIPFNAVYGPARPAGRALPELLTPGLVIEALKSSRS